MSLLDGQNFCDKDGIITNLVEYRETSGNVKAINPDAIP
jgi:hypothetical protein